MPATRAEALCQCDEEQFNRQLTTAFDGRLGLCKVAGRAAPSRSPPAMPATLPASGWCWWGCRSHHPPAGGAGVNLGLLDAAALAEQILRNQAAGKDIYRLTNLRGYERWRKSEAASMLAAMEGLKRLFAGSNPLKKLVRGAGLCAFDLLTPLKQSVIRAAMGLEGELPALAKGEKI